MAGVPPADPSFEAHLAQSGIRLRRGRVTTLQVNIGKRCNLACLHCHVESGPKRTEALDAEGVDRILLLLARNPAVATLDITGGAPELHPEFRRLIVGARGLGLRVIDRCNLTIFYELGQETMPEFLAEHGVDIVASLPCYEAASVDGQRGRGVFKKSIEALQWLNRLGYARPGTGLRLDLVYNPTGPTLPPSQSELEVRYRGDLQRRFGIRFDRLVAIANMPIKRFAHSLRRDGEYEAYQALLVERFNPETVPELMCRHTLSVDHTGRLYDCDFNQAAGLATAGPARGFFDIADLTEFTGAPVTTASHCFGCTAGAGSSCGGELA
ncbi:MAG: arsenosugar biosynthesis radical SAM protein ArsS [Deltaproteobacteria bacterium]|nr:arsenosugar biosynthesis radical SAM protein ArsS [Deltaproteobacteria bacterium]